MALFKNTPQQANVSPRQALRVKYSSARGNLLLAIVFTLVNMVLLLTNANSYFLFSVFIPYMLIDQAMFYTGRYPAEIYEEYNPDMVFSSEKLLYILVGIAFMVLVAYILCWFFSKNKSGWLVTALVLFSLDTVVYLLYSLIYGMFSLGSVIDILFHAWVLYYLIAGLVANAKLKKLPTEELLEEGEQEAVTTEENGTNE